MIEIEKIYKEGLNQLENSKSFYFQAENLLLKELKLNNYNIKETLSYIVNLHDVKAAHRIDAEYFQPKYRKLVSRIKNQNIKPLLDEVESVQGNFNPIIHPKKIFKYVELSGVDSSIGIIDDYFEVQGEKAPSRARRILKAGDVIVSSVEGSLTKVALVAKEQEGYLASTGFFQFRSRQILPEVLLAVAKSPILQMQLEKQTSGTILTAVPKEAIRKIFIPILPKLLQQRIAELVRKSHEARKMAKEYFKKSKLKVERIISE